MMNYSEVELEFILRERNPWWDTLNWEDNDKVREYLKPNKRDIFYSIRDRIRVHSNTQQRGIVLVGPRRVGKSVLQYQTIQWLVRELIEECGKNRRDIRSELKRILYFSCDDFKLRNVPIVDIISFYRNTILNKKEIPFLFIDEIQYSPDWSVALKNIYDMKYGNFFVTGSASTKLRKGRIESGAGRWDDIVLYPMTFSEYLSMFAGDHERKFSGFFSVWKEGETPRRNFYLEKYVSTGGFPGYYDSDDAATPVIEELKIWERMKQDIIDKVLQTDIRVWENLRNTDSIRDVFSWIVDNSGGLVNETTLARTYQINRISVRDSLDLLENSFLSFRLKPFGIRAGKGQQKTYVIDTGILNACRTPIPSPDYPIGGVTVESAVAVNLHAIAKSLGYALFHGDRSFGNKGGVDFILTGDDRNIPIEVVWSANEGEINSHSGRLFHCLKTIGDKRSKEGILLAKSERYVLYKEEDFKVHIYPIADYLACL